ncbi:beta strand repeat-containing protein [Amycolatopsis nigrescens]|uniref:beta strand repeat-containing protein n=1 Tax=Amycolatopsis nigrescens TaxID=381445 RepID=UPI0003AA6C80|nr:chaplin family protein [Amycolatopsis nigrescens]
MQSWAKRGIQTALVTGGLLMLGTGIASADERAAGPDTPAGPLDLSVNIPYELDGNAIGTPLGQLDVPAAKGELSTKPLTAPLSGATAPAAKMTEPVAKAANSVGKEAAKTAAKTDAQQAPSGDIFKGNKISGDLTVPLQICDNAIGVVGDAKAEGAGCDQTTTSNKDISTDGTNSGLAGNAVVLDWALPVQIAGNAVGAAGGSGYATGSATQSTTETGDITTSGDGSGTSGNVVAGQFATPIQVTGNAASWPLANAYSDYQAETEAESGGWIKTSGDGGSASGNVGGVPIALPVKFNGNSAAAWGSDADSVSSSEADASAGDTTPGMEALDGSGPIDSYIQTTGDQSFLAGNIAQPQGALVANVASVAASWIGNATTGNALGKYQESASSHSSEVEAGGFSSTSADQAAGSGNIADAPIALPVEACGVGGTYIGNAHAACDNEIEADAGDGTYTSADETFLGGNSVNPALASTAEVFGIGGSHIGNATGTATETKKVEAGGYNGTTGTDSAGAGNLVQVPLAVPAEVFGIGGSYIGQGQADASEVKEVTAGGGGNTDDDNGFLTSNAVAGPVSLPAQVFGIGASHIGRGVGEATADTTSTAGGDVNATGKEAGAAGNIVFPQVSLPTQVHGIGGSFIGTGDGTSDNLTDSKAGGKATADGQDGAVAGNVVPVPVGGAASVADTAAGLAALVSGQGVNDVVSEAGGDTETNGDGGGVSGNIVTAQGLPIVQVFGDAVAAGAKATGIGANITDASSGGDTTTSGINAGGSGNIIDVPVAAVPQVFGDAVAAAGVADAVSENETDGTVGGDSTTSPGNVSGLSGIDGQLPVGALVQLFDVSLPVLGHAMAEATNDTDIDNDPLINLPIDGDELPATSLPALPTALPELPAAPAMPAVQQREDTPAAVSGDLFDVVPGEVLTLPENPLSGVRVTPEVSTLEATPLSPWQKVVGFLTGKPMHIQG